MDRPRSRLDPRIPLVSSAPGPARLMTAEEFAAGGPKYDHCELWDGVLWVHDPAGGGSPNVAFRLGARLGAHLGERPGAGWGFGPDQGFLVAADPPRVLCPDLAFVSRTRLASLPAKGFLPLAPDFCVEVRSPDDPWVGVLEKCGRWLAHGVPVVWALNPRRRRVVVFRPSERPQEARPGDVVDATPVLPDFRVAVSDLFAGF